MLELMLSLMLEWEKSFRKTVTSIEFTVYELFINLYIILVYA